MTAAAVRPAAPGPGAAALDTSDAACLIRILDCDPDALSLMDRLLWERMSNMRDRLARAMHNEEGHSLAPVILRIYEALPAASQARILVSAEFGEWYTIYNQWRAEEAGADQEADEERAGVLLQGLLDIVLRERSIARLQAGQPADARLAQSRTSRVWSCIGDRFAQRGERGEWRLASAPTIGDVVAIDFDSPLAGNYEARSGVLSQPMLAFGEEEQQQVVDKLGEALRQMDRLEPAYGALVRNFVRRIIVRKSLEEGAEPGPGQQVVGSEHVPRQPGSIRMLNVHLSKWTIAACMESLLHESIHNVLAAWEVVHGAFTHRQQDYRPISFWSGNPIPNSSFMHAIFVYFGCHRLFALHRASLVEAGAAAGDPEYDHVDRRLKIFGSGFLMEQPLDAQFLLPGDQLQPHLAGAVAAMQARMRNYYGEASRHAA